MEIIPFRLKCAIFFFFFLRKVYWGNLLYELILTWRNELRSVATGMIQFLSELGLFILRQQNVFL